VISLSVHPNKIYSHKSADVILRLTNKGGGACTNVSLSFRLSREIIVIGGKSRLPRIDRIEAGRQYDYLLHLKATDIGDFQLYIINFSYLDPAGRSIRPEPIVMRIQSLSGQPFVAQSVVRGAVIKPFVVEPSGAAALQPQAVAQRSKIFVSYSHKDLCWLQRVRTHLNVLENEGIYVDVWDDTKISAGMKWGEEIQRALSCAKIALLLITTDFLASRFIANNELPPLLQAAEEDGVKIMPLIIKPSRFKNHKKLSQYQALNNPSEPLVNLSEGQQDEILVQLTNSIEAYLQ